MAEKKNTPKRQVSKAKEEVAKKVETKDYSEVLNKILICLYALIAILVINTTILLVKDGSTKTNITSDNSEENVDYDVSMFTSVTADTLGEAVSSDTAKIVYIGRSTCGYCVQFLPILQQAQTDYGYETLYLDITTVTTTEQQDKILAFDNEEEFLKENFGGTPMVLLMKNGKIVDTWIGYAEYSEYSAWLEKNGFAKK